MKNAREIHDDWIRQGADPYFLQYLLITTREQETMRLERHHDAQLQEPITMLGRYLKKALRELRRIDRLTSVPSPTGNFILNEYFRKPLELMARSYPALGGRPLKHGRPSKEHLYRFTCVLGDYLKELRVRRRWEDITSFVSGLGLAVQLDPEEIRKRCSKYRKDHPSALEKARQDSRRHWGME